MTTHWTGDNNSGGQGADTFILAVGEGKDTITDFEIGIDQIGLADGLSFGQLTFSGNDILANDNTLATLDNVVTSSLSESSFSVV